MAKGKHKPQQKVPPGGRHHEGFDKAMKNALDQLEPGQGETFRVEFSVKVTPNPGWVIEYIVDLT